jgi:hypothetical protein
VPAGAWRTTGAANVWSTITADPARGLVFLPVFSAAPDFIGVDRQERTFQRLRSSRWTQPPGLSVAFPDRPSRPCGLTIYRHRSIPSGAFAATEGKSIAVARDEDRFRLRPRPRAVRRLFRRRAPVPKRCAWRAKLADATIPGEATPPLVPLIQRNSS